MKPHHFVLTGAIAAATFISLANGKAEPPAYYDGGPGTYRIEEWSPRPGVTCRAEIPTQFASAMAPTVYTYTWTNASNDHPCSDTPQNDTMTFPKVAFAPSEVQVETWIDGSHFLRGNATCWDCACCGFGYLQPPDGNFCDGPLDDPPGQDYGTKWRAYNQAVCTYTNWPGLHIDNGLCPYSPAYNSQFFSYENPLIHRGDVDYDPASGGTYSVDGVEFTPATWRNVGHNIMSSWNWDAGGFSDPTSTTIFTEDDRDIMGAFHTGGGDFTMEWGLGFDQDLDWIGCTHQYTETVVYNEVEFQIRIYP